MERFPEHSRNQRQAIATLLFALLLLFFIQLFALWIENTYRLSLIKLRMGKELLSVFFLLAPLLLLVATERIERGFLWVALGVFLGARLACPMLHAAPQTIVASLGVAAFLILLCFALSRRYEAIRGDIGVATGLAILASVCLRSMRASFDISIEGTASVIVWPFAIVVPYLFWRVLARQDPVPPALACPFRHRVPATIGLFANFALIYLVLSCPAVVNAWCGGGVPGYMAVVACAALAFGAAVLGVAPRVAEFSRRVLLAWNLLFIVTLVGGILLLTPALPATPTSGPLVVRGWALPARIVLALMLVLSPVVLFNLRRCASLAAGARPRAAVLPVLLGAAVLFAITTAALFTNVWGYVPGGLFFRNRFYLPYLLACLCALVPFLVRAQAIPPAQGAPAGPHLMSLLRRLTAALAVLAIAGTFWRAWPTPSATPPPRITVLTYNMQQGSRENADRDYLGQLALLRTLNADIIGLQECDTPRPSGGFIDPVRFFADSLGYYAYYGPNTVSGTYGTAILSRYPIRNPHTFFTFSDEDEIGTAAAEIDVGGRLVAFFCNHPAGSDAVRSAHIEALLAEASPYADVVAVGDFNLRPSSPHFAKLAQVFGDSAATLGEANVNGHGAPVHLAAEIDHIFLSRTIRAIESHYLQPPESRTDHPAHWAILELE